MLDTLLVLAITWLIVISTPKEIMSAKKTILDAALTLCAENGYDGTSVEQIARSDSRSGSIKI